MTDERPPTTYVWRTPDDGVPAALRASRERRWLPHAPERSRFRRRAAIAMMLITVASLFATVVIALCLVASLAMRDAVVPTTCQVTQANEACDFYSSTDRHWHRLRMTYGHVEDRTMPNGWVPR